MPWYYAGPEAKPVGPVSLEELQALRARGVIAPETYVIEEKGQGTSGLAWKRYQETFPVTTGLPPLPPVTAAPYIPPPVPPVPSVMSAQPSPAHPGAHPLFPSAAPGPGQPPVFAPPSRPDMRPDPYYRGRSTNGWCAWGFGLGLASFLFAFVCGIGLFPALLALPLCIIGLVQVQKHREQAGQWLAVWGLVLSGLALIISLVFALWLAVPIMKAHGLSVTEETTNDSE